MSDNLALGFIRFVGEENNGLYRYEFILTDNLDEFWGDNFDYCPACLCNGIEPFDEYITEIKTMHFPYKLSLIQDNCCFGMQDALDGICALGYAYDKDDNLLCKYNFGDAI